MSPSSYRLTTVLLCAASAWLLPLRAGAQAAATAVRSVSVDLYGGGAVSQTDYNSVDKGFVIGGDFTYHLHYFDASLDLRFNRVTGAAVGEKSFDGGIKLSRAYGRFHPYAHFLVGYGVITFDYPQVNPDGSLYSYDNSTVYDLGGGVDISLTHSFALKVDGQYQYWNLGDTATSIKLNPTLGTIGLVYHLPYRFLRPRHY